MKRILFVSLAVVLALSVGLIGCGDGGNGGPEPSEEIVIGSSRSMTGALATIHATAFGPISDAYLADVNTVRDPTGINVDGTYFPVDTRFLNDGSIEATLVSHINTLIDEVEEGLVHTIFGPTSTHFIDVVAPITNDAGVVLITAEGGATSLMEAGYLPAWPYVFVTLSFSNWYQLPVLAPLLVGEGASTVYIYWQNDAHGLEYLATAGERFPQAGLTIVGNSSVLNPMDYDSEIEKANTASPDAVCCFCYPDEIVGLTVAAMGKGYNFDAWVTGPGGNFGFFGTYETCPPFLPPSFGPAADGIMCFAVGNNKTSTAMADLFNNKLGGAFCFQDVWGHPLYWAALQIWENAVKEVGTVDAESGGFLIDQDALKAELASYDSDTNGVETVLGTTWYSMYEGGGGLIDYQCHTGQIGQWQNGFIEVIAPTQVLDEEGSLVSIGTFLPNYVATSTNITYPKPNWPS